MHEAPSKFIIKYTQKFSAIKILDTELFPVWLSVSTDLIGNTPIEGEEFKLGIAKLDFWFTNIVQNSLMFSLENDWAIEMNPPQNLPLVTPYAPTDDVLALLFNCKCNALAAGAFEASFFTVEDESSSLSFTYADDELPNLPSFDKERSFFSQPWWHRDDSSTFDIMPGEDADITKPPEFFFLLNFLKDRFNGPAEIIRPSFKPTIISTKKK